MEQDLNSRQKELVAVGASVGAGCQPCVSHHLKAGAEVGLEGEQLLAVVASAERVAAEAAVAIGDHARGKLAATVTSPALLSQLEEALASLGAAVGANDVANIERQLRAAAQHGASLSQLRQAIDTAHNVQENAARIHLREAARLLDTIGPTLVGDAAAANGADCGCGGGESEQASTAAEQPERELAASGHSEGCGEIAAAFAAGGKAGPMVGCREMFARFMPRMAPAETAQTTAAPVATGPCTKEG